jgi:hypothetical protein
MKIFSRILEIDVYIYIYVYKNPIRTKDLKNLYNASVLGFMKDDYLPIPNK